MTQEQYEKVQRYLLENGQQELAGHLDGLWQELDGLRKNRDDEYGDTHSQQEGESAQDFQDRNKSADEDSTTTTDNPAPAAGEANPTPHEQ